MRRVRPAKVLGGCAIKLAILLVVTGLYGCGGGGGDEAPSRSASAVGDNSAILEWDPPEAGSPSGYRIYYGTASGVYLLPFGQGVDVRNVTTYMISGLSSGTRYYFSATAYDILNNESAYSNEVFKDVP